MIKLMRNAVIAITLAFAVIAKSHAVFIGFSPSIQPGATGDFVSMDLIVSGLGDGAAPSISTFDVDIGYDAAALAVDGWTFSDELGLVGLDALDFSLGDFGGTLALSVLSLIVDPADLDALQGSTVTLATITFEVLALAPGDFTDVTIDTIYALGDGFGDSLDVTATGIGRIGTPIPEPASIALVLLGLMGLRRVRR